MKLLASVATAAMLAAFSMIFFYAPIEATQGLVHKIFYIHVACAITMYFGFFIAFLAGLFYLLERKEFWDEFAVAGAEVGFLFCTIVLVTGPIWGKPIWGAWWTWDPRLTTTLLLWLLYAGYLVLRGYFMDSPRGRVVTSIVAVIAFIDVPLIHFSVRLWRGIHPSVMSSEGGGMPSNMKYTLTVTMVSTFVWFAAVIMMRWKLEKSKNQLARLETLLSEEQ